MWDWWGESTPDYEDAILARQEMIEILEDEGIGWTPSDDYNEFDYPCGKIPDYYKCIKCKRWKITCDGGFGYD